MGDRAAVADLGGCTGAQAAGFSGFKNLAFGSFSSVSFVCLHLVIMVVRGWERQKHGVRRGWRAPPVSPLHFQDSPEAVILSHQLAGGRTGCSEGPAFHCVLSSSMAFCLKQDICHLCFAVFSKER